jgi:hypothetical protein
MHADGADLTRPQNETESYFVDKIAARKHVEARAAADSSLGYTYAMTGLFTDFMLAANILFLSDDKKSANLSGAPENKLTTTFSGDVAKFIVLSLSPSHFSSLSAHRELRFSGSTLSFAEIFSTIGQVLGHPIAVTYGSKEETYTFEAEQKKLGNDFLYKFTSARRSIGFGGSILEPTVNEEYKEIQPVPFAEVVKQVFLT